MISFFASVDYHTTVFSTHPFAFPLTDAGEARHTSSYALGDHGKPSTSLERVKPSALAEHPQGMFTPRYPPH